MGVKGLTTFINNRSRDYYEDYALHDSYLVLDGHSISSQLYKWHCRRNDCFGGDYDKFANVVLKFFELLLKCKIIPLVIFDGGYEKRKLKTVRLRLEGRIQTAKALNPVTGDNEVVFPIFLHYLFIDVCRKLNVKCMKTEFECDGEAAYLAKSLNCPILSYDSDFYIFDVIYIPFNTMDLVVRKLRDSNSFYVPCQVYRVDKFLNSFGGLDKMNLPILSMLLGNDYVNRKCFSAFYRQVKMQKCKGSDQQRRIKSVIKWLQNQSPESAISNILKRFKLQNRRTIADKIRNSIESYNVVNSKVLEFFNIKPRIKNDAIKPIKIEVNDEDEPDEEEPSGSDASDDDSESSDEICQEDDSKYTTIITNVSRDFRSNFHECLYPSFFMDMLTLNTYYCIVQMEDYSDPDHSHKISLEIISTIYKVLVPEGTKKNLFCVARDENCNLKKSVLNFSKLGHDLPQLKIIEQTDPETLKLMFCHVLECPNHEFLNKFPQSWHVFVLSVRYWIIKSDNCDMASIYALILCSIIVNLVDTKIDKSCRSSFASQFGSYRDEEKRAIIGENRIVEAIKLISHGESVICMRKLVDYFQTDVKMKRNPRLFRRDLIHKFAQFQSCALHIKFFNALLRFPIPEDLIISNFYNGTFLHNMACNLSKRSNLEAYFHTLLLDCPAILNALQLIVGEILNNVGNTAPPTNVNKRRRKNKPIRIPKVQQEDTSKDIDSEDEPYDFGSNRFALLSVLK